MKIVLTGGVTGGHIYPAIAIGDKFREKDPSCEIIYIASGEPLEREIISKAGYELFEVQSEPMHRNNPFRMASTLIKTMKGRSQAMRIMKDFKPDIIVSTGSFVSVPVVLAGAALGARIFLHEQNGFPGVSNKFLAKYAEKVFLGFEAAGQYFKEKEKTVYSGNPVRAEFSGRDKSADRAGIGIPEDDFVVMVFGGSLGSETTNAVGEALAVKYADREGFTLVWGTGKEYYEDIKSRLDQEGFEPENIRIVPYINDMPQMLSACDISICRSGALSVAETTMAGRAAVFIPSPNVTEDHQYYNAKAVLDAGGAFIVREEEGAKTCVSAAEEIIEKLDGDRELLKKMQEASRAIAPCNAADIIYEAIVAAETESVKTIDENSETENENGKDGNSDSESEIEIESENESEEYPAEAEIDDEDSQADEGSGIGEKYINEDKSGAEAEKESASEPETEQEPEPELSEEDRAIAERIRLRKIATAKRRRRHKRRLIELLILIVLLVTGLILSFTSIFTVDSIEVNGNSHYSAEEIISMGHAVPGKNLIYHPDKKEIKHYLELNPYIKSAEVRRKLPSTLVITVSERTQLMALKYDDDYLILDREGILLQKSRTKPKLTIIEGNVINKIKLGEPLGTQDEKLMSKTIDFVQAMADNDLYYVKVDLSDPLTARAYVYDTLVVRGEYNVLMENMEKGRLHMVLDNLFSGGIRRGTITFDNDGVASFMPSI
ncbi:MAG: undecaprenyldiphospho-muramoylpentapeptide beta-N-acetylglucosaminyltransferase [Mogibacterium sp.]|nr:undecaprenyldiphospho-muramoylpentapeptide beta-N-acetylglucosaminyltransferase [Mogibacterium sp.]